MMIYIMVMMFNCYKMEHLQSNHMSLMKIHRDYLIMLKLNNDYDIHYFT